MKLDRFKSKSIALFAISILAVSVYAQEDTAIFPTHTLEFPLIADDYSVWETKGAAVFGK